MKPRGGAYILVLHLPQRRKIRIGALGDIDFAAGAYVYVGSARRGLAQRIERHRRVDKKMHWHIDYLLSAAQITSILVSADATEVEIAGAFRVNPGFSVIRGFGAGDSPLPGHLFHCGRHSNNDKIRLLHLLKRAAPGNLEDYDAELT